jgi:hypothetical protein
MIISAALIVLLTLEQILFGRDTPGVAHDISVVAWIGTLAAAVVFLLLLVMWAMQRSRRRAALRSGPTSTAH